ncbi:hypothetical protein AA0Z99_04180 [Agrococcus sp. 1P02AA]|uniref:hypothetical protein n=1 Tax=Agrococcus sp. 1P02AA TaxID=3132259 RepID=UPI0039A42347
MTTHILLADAKVPGESALHFALADAAPGSIATTVTHAGAIVAIDLDADGRVLGITIDW